jgi:hypothetical protein
MSHGAFVDFIALQALDVLTTWFGLSLGAGEGSPFIVYLFRFGFGSPTALLISKAACMLFVIAAIALGRARLLRILIPWYAAVVTWNSLVIFAQAHISARI